jgi:hypothetical protein
VSPLVALPLNYAANLVLLVFRIPLLGRLLGQGVRLLQEALCQLLNVVDLLLSAAGIRLKKTLRLHLVVLRADGIPVVPADALRSQIETVQRVLAAAGIELDVRIHFDHCDSPPAVLDVGCNARAYWEDLWTPGRFFERAAQRYAFHTAFRRLIGIGSPLFAFVVRSMAGCFIGCSLGAAADYVTLASNAVDDPRLLAHEIGHALGLLHRRDRDNLLCRFSDGGIALTAWQCAVIRGSRHVTIF